MADLFDLSREQRAASYEPRAPSSDVDKLTSRPFTDHWPLATGHRPRRCSVKFATQTLDLRSVLPAIASLPPTRRSIRQRRFVRTMRLLSANTITRAAAIPRGRLSKSRLRHSRRHAGLLLQYGVGGDYRCHATLSPGEEILACDDLVRRHLSAVLAHSGQARHHTCAM